MTVNGILQCTLYMVVLIGLARPLGTFMARVYEGERTFFHPLLGPVERMFTASRESIRGGHDLEELRARLPGFNVLGLVAVTRSSACRASCR
jgi:K+-transporting ATPase ATPase A chain